MACSRRSFLTVLLATVPLTAAQGQLIPVRVVPVAEADQFGFFPSANFGMANVSIALRDSLLGPYHNPALGARIQRAVYYGAPTFFSVTNDAGSGQTYPLGVIARRGKTFAGGTYAVQEINPARPRQEPFVGIGVLSLTVPGPPTINAQPNRTQSNHYGHATVGHTFPGNWTIGANAQWSNLRAMEGMELLFTGSHNVRQRGERSEVRVGLLKEWNDRSFEAVVLRNDLDMAYDVGYAQLYWDPAQRQPKVQTLDVHAATWNRTTGLHLKYEMPFRDSTWRAGAIATFNAIRESGAPFYEFMGIPRDPSRTRAYNLGVGVSRREGHFSFGADAILEPIWRRAAGVVDTNSLAVFAPGTNREDSYFKFRNVVLRAAVSRDIVMPGADSRLQLQAGGQLRNVNYELEQHNILQGVFQQRTKGWQEWTHGWGANFIFPRFQFGYQLRVLSGMGRLGVPPDDLFAPTIDVFPGRNGSTAVTLYPVRVASHQMFFSVPIR